MSQSISSDFHISIKVTHIHAYELQPPYEHFFSYQITIKNNSKQSAQLISRFWRIVDGSNQPEFVNGLGVIGQQPTLEPGESFTYTSGCPLISPIGQMSGAYSFLNLVDQSTFTVDIPPFELQSQFSLN